jgi:magnesium transporter
VKPVKHRGRGRKKRFRLTPAGAPASLSPAASPTSVPTPAAPKPVIRLMAYGPQELSEQGAGGARPLQASDLENLREHLARWPVTWIDVDGLGDPQVIHTLGEVFGLHPLVLEDVVHVHQRAKVEHYERQLFIVARMAGTPHWSETEQLSLILGPNFVLTFQEGRPGDPFDPVRERLHKAGGRIRSAGADYLAYSLLDAVTDAYFPVLEDVGERVELLEDQILAQPGRTTFHHIHDLKRELLALRRAVWPLREAISTLIREPTALITDETRLYLRDCYDHAVRIIDFVETYRELGSDLMDLYLSSISQRMTEVMKVLTIIATIFIPLTFISSIYGMNFSTAKSPWNMPELEWYWGYPFALLLMATVALGLVGYFWWKGWLSSSPLSDPGAHGDEQPPLNHGP